MTNPADTGLDTPESQNVGDGPELSAVAGMGADTSVRDSARRPVQFMAKDIQAHGGISVETAGEVSVVRLWGEIDVMRRDEASAALATAIDSLQHVVIDTTDVTFIDSSGIAFLVQFCMVGAEEGLNVRVLHPPQVVRDVLTMLGLDHIMGTEAAETSLTSLFG